MKIAFEIFLLSKKIADMAETYGVEVIPHSWGTGIAIHAAMHLIGKIF